MTFDSNTFYKAKGLTRRQITISPDIAKRLNILAISHGMTTGEVVSALVSASDNPVIVEILNAAQKS